MKRFVEGEARSQATLFPERIDDYISEENPVRVVDVFVNGLDLGVIGFKTEPAATGRPAYHPSTMLKLFIYGYLNRIQSSRRLEREAGRNVELMWLLGRLAPDFKTIADFRKNNGKGIRKVCSEFVQICRKLELFSDAVIAIDGSKFKGVNTRDKNFTKAKIKYRLDQIDESIARYLSQIASADRRDDSVANHKIERLEIKIRKLNDEIKKLNKVESQLSNTSDKQVSLTDPDAKSMATSGRGTGVVGYNVQTAVDAKHHIIVTHEVTNVGHDRSALYRTAQLAKETIGSDTLDVVADRGYYNGLEIYRCEQNQITTYLPKVQTSGNMAKGLFGKRDFKWIKEDNEFECPARKRLIWRFETQEKGKTINKYWSSDCPQCAIKDQCTTGKYRRVTRWEHEDVLDQVEARIEKEPEKMAVRRATVEHPFGTIKSWMGATHFQMKTLKHVSTEMSLHVLAYNLKRAMKVLGINRLMEAVAA